jgi:hypothetical protein
MEQFRIPRKIKKSLKGNLWLYPPDEKGNSVMAFPGRSQEDYTAFKNGIVRNVFDPKNAKARRKAFSEKLDQEIIVTDEVLKRYVDDIFQEDFRTLSYNILKAAKKNEKAIPAYYNFVNAYQLFESGEQSYGNICCLSVDKAKEILKKAKALY